MQRPVTVPSGHEAEETSIEVVWDGVLFLNENHHLGSHVHTRHVFPDAWTDHSFLCAGADRISQNMLGCKEISAGQILQIGSFASAMLRPAKLSEISALPWDWNIVFWFKEFILLLFGHFIRNGREIVQSCQILLAFQSKVPTEMALLKRPPAYSFGLYPKGPTCHKLCHFECFSVSSSCRHVPLDLSKPVQVAWKCNLAISSTWQPSVFIVAGVSRSKATDFRKLRDAVDFDESKLLEAPRPSRPGAQKKTF